MTSRLITQPEYASLFHDHVAALLATARKQYTAALEELVRPALVGSDGNVLIAAERGAVAMDWRAASEALSMRACFQKLSSQERQERWQVFVGGPDAAHRISSTHPSNRHRHQNRDRENPDVKRSRR